MCGINGIFGIKAINNMQKRIDNMNKMITHRGPDAKSHKIFNDICALGHRRLSIIDTNQRSNQPMVSNSGEWTIVFNGEIYNYLDLKNELKYDFKTNSDTEVIIAYVEEFGIEKFLNDSNGMFSIALYNSLKNELILARDRLGIKPLFYFKDSQKIIFSSEIKGILASGLVEAKLNESAIDEYLGYRYIREPYTFFEEINQLKSGHYMVIDSKLNINIKKYWELPKEFNFNNDYDEDSLEKKFKAEVERAIKNRLMADVPLGTYLSGGVDSSLISAITSNLSEDKLNTYTIGFPELNEFEYARMVSDKYDTNHHEINLDVDKYFGLMDEIIEFKDGPLGVPNEIPLAYMSKVLKEKITVVLSGEGADELMGGYGRIYRSPYDYENRKEDIDKSFYEYFVNKYEYVPRSIRDEVLNVESNLRVEFDNKIINEFKDKRNEENIFKFFHKYHVKGLLNRVDITTMYASIEARVPFLDHKLIEFVYKEVPYDLKLRWKSEELKKDAANKFSSDYSEVNDIPKYLLRKIGYDYLPKEIIERKKVGFPVPLNDWMTSLEFKARELLKDAYWLKQDKLEDLIKKSKENQRSGQILWMFINIEIFRKKYFEKKWTY